MNTSPSTSLQSKPAVAASAPPTPTPAPAPARPRYVLGLDVDLRFVVTATQCGHGAIKPAQKLTRPQLLEWVRAQVAAGHAVHTVYEACGFGYTLHHALVAAGAHSLVSRPRGSRRNARARTTGSTPSSSACAWPATSTATRTS